MAEIKNFWTVSDYPGGSDELFTDPELKDRKEAQLAHMSAGLDSGGISLHRLIRIYNGTGQDRWEKEKTKVYDNEAEARKDAEARLAKVRAKFEKSQGKKASVEDEIVTAVATKFIASESIPKGTVFEVVMKHGDWWSEMRRGAQVEAKEDGKYGSPMKFSHFGWAQGGWEMTPTKSGGKIKLMGDPRFKRALTVKVVEKSDE